MRRARFALTLAAASGIAAGTTVAQEPPPAIVVVVEVEATTPAEQAGIQVGDVLDAWLRSAVPPANPQPAQGRLESPLDLHEIETNQSPRGPVTVTGSRGGKPMAWTIRAAPFGLKVRPSLPGPLLALYEEGRERLRAEDARGAAERWRGGAAAAGSAGDSDSALWFSWIRAAGLADAQAWPEADAAYEESAGEAEEGGRLLLAGQLRFEWGVTFMRRSDWDAAIERFQRALSVHRRLGPGSLGITASLQALGITSIWGRSDLEVGEAYCREALAIEEREAPRDLGLDSILSCLAMASSMRGDLAAAEAYWRRGLAIAEEVAPGGFEVAGALMNLASVAERRGDLVLAESYYQRALALHQKRVPDGPDVALSLINLGQVARVRGDLAVAQDYLERALGLLEKTPNRFPAMALGGLGAVAADAGRLAEAESHHRRALELLEKLVPDSLFVAESLDNLGRVLTRRGDLSGAEDPLRRALGIRQKLAPGSAAQAESLYALAALEGRRGRLDESAGLHLRALEALERQTTRLGGTQEARSSFAAKYSGYYREAIDALLALKRPAEAVQVLERSRARTFLALLAERDLVFAPDIPADLARERRLADARYEREQGRLSQLSPATAPAEVEAALARLRELRERQEEIATRIRRASPRVASLRYPEPLGLDEVRRALDAGTVLLAYAVGAEHTTLFVVQAQDAPGSGLSVFTLPVGEKELRERIEAFRADIQRDRAWEAATLMTEGAALYDLLLRPAEERLADSRRLLISPDGPLHSLPFAALARRSGASPASYLVEWKPLHVVASATVYAELQKSRRAAAAAAPTLVAFGNPRYPAGATASAERMANPEVRSLLVRGVTFSPLPGTRQEVESISRLFGGSARKYLGPEATEERAKSLGSGARYIHFACHGSLDERFPLSSALALTIPEQPRPDQENGLLQAWEIFDRVRIDADLVTLSACRTALGKEMGGEGLLGLTRAFHFAGARSVLATLWGVPDASTSGLMTSFYRHLKAGRSRDEALRLAQLEFIHPPGGRRPRSPFRWAAFQLSGNWR